MLGWKVGTSGKLYLKKKKKSKLKEQNPSCADSAVFGNQLFSPLPGPLHTQLGFKT